MNHIRSNGLDFAYLEEGEGPLVLLLHGFPDTAHSWSHQVPALAAAGYRAVAPYLRGYPPSEIPRNGFYDRATLATDIAALIRALGGGARARLVGQDPLVLEPHRAEVTAFARKRRLPALYPWRFYVDAGGLMAYDAYTPKLQRRAATYVDRILKGAKPADLPVEQPTTFELVINLKTAKALSLTIPPLLLQQADQIID